MDKVCGVCGNVGYRESLVMCSQCRAYEHIYCTKNDLLEFSDEWYCDECQTKKSHNITKSQLSKALEATNSPDARKEIKVTSSLPPKHGKRFSDKTNPKELESTKVKFIPSEDIVWSNRGSSITRKCNLNVSQRSCGSRDFAPSPGIPRTLSVGKSTLRSSKSVLMPPPKKVAFDAEAIITSEQMSSKEELKKNKPSVACKNRLNEEPSSSVDALHYPSRTRPMTSEPGLPPVHSCDGKRECRAPIASATVSCSGSGSQNKDRAEKMFPPKTLIMDPQAKLLQHPTSMVCWKGSFDVFGMTEHFKSEIGAHFPGQVSPKVYDKAKAMPEKLKLEILPRSEDWPKIFQTDLPDLEDIGLYFLLLKDERPKEEYAGLIKFISTHDFAMRTYIDNTKLLIYSSCVLPTDVQRIDEQLYLWGVFRPVKKQNMPKSEQFFSNHPSVDTKISNNGQENASGQSQLEVPDTARASGISSKNKPIQRLHVPPGFVEPTSNAGNGRHTNDLLPGVVDRQLDRNGRNALVTPSRESEIKASLEKHGVQSKNYQAADQMDRNQVHASGSFPRHAIGKKRDRSCFSRPSNANADSPSLANAKQPFGSMKSPFLPVKENTRRSSDSPLLERRSRYGEAMPGCALPSQSKPEFFKKPDYAADREMHKAEHTRRNDRDRPTLQKMAEERRVHHALHQSRMNEKHENKLKIPDSRNYGEANGWETMERHISAASVLNKPSPVLRHYQSLKRPTQPLQPVKRSNTDTESKWDSW